MDSKHRQWLDGLEAGSPVVVVETDSWRLVYEGQVKRRLLRSGRLVLEDGTYFDYSGGSILRRGPGRRLMRPEVYRERAAAMAEQAALLATLKPGDAVLVDYMGACRSGETPKPIPPEWGNVLEVNRRHLVIETVDNEVEVPLTGEHVFKDYGLPFRVLRPDNEVAREARARYLAERLRRVSYAKWRSLPLETLERVWTLTNGQSVSPAGEGAAP